MEDEEEEEEETGPINMEDDDDGIGGYVCKPGTECRLLAAPPLVGAAAAPREEEEGEDLDAHTGKGSFADGKGGCEDGKGQLLENRTESPERLTMKQIVGEQTFTEQPRSLIRCHTPGCQYLVHPDVEFGSFCCCKCYYRFEFRATCKKRKHGEFCTYAEAPAAAQRGLYVHPVWYRQCQQQHATAAAAASPIAPPPAPPTPEAAATEAAPIAPAPAAAAAAAAAARAEKTLCQLQYGLRRFELSILSRESIRNRRRRT